MKVWLYRRRYSEQGGAERFTQRLASALHERGYEVWIVAEEWLPSRVGEYQVRKAPSHGLKGFAKYCLDHISRHERGVILSLERTYQQDIYRAGDGVHTAWLARRAPYQKGIDRLWSKWSQRHRLILELEKHLFAREATGWVVANSPMVRDEICSYYPHYPVDRIRVIHPGVDLRRFVPCTDSSRRETLRKEFNVPQDAVVWCFVGSGFERKGLRWAIEIAACHGPSSVWLLVLGKGKRLAYEAQARRLGFDSRLIFLNGGIASLDVYHASDAFILPTVYDPCSNATLEATACGLPVITTRGNGAAYYSRGVVLDDPSNVDEGMERTREYVVPWRLREEWGAYRERIDEGPCWKAWMDLVQTSWESCRAAL